MGGTGEEGWWVLGKVLGVEGSTAAAWVGRGVQEWMESPLSIPRASLGIEGCFSPCTLYQGLNL